MNTARRLVAVTSAALVMSHAPAQSQPIKMGPPAGFKPIPHPTAPPKPLVGFTSGFIPKPCGVLRLTGSPTFLDCWLQNTPSVANWIAWEVHTTNPPSAQLVNWAFWDDGRKKDLRDTYAAATKWYDGGMTTYTGTHVDDVPANREEPWVETTALTVLDEHTAWTLYVAHVAFSLAAEINAWVPWSLRGYDAAAMQDLFRSHPGMFIYTPPSPNDFYHSTYVGYVVTHDSTPTHPIVSFKFLKTHGLIGGSSRQTLANVIDWARANLRHFIGSGTIDNLYQTWQYKGAPPVARVLTGTVSTDPSLHDPDLHHWTEGCYGTTDFLVWLLKVVNIPAARRVSSATCSHTMPYFSGERLYLSHGDDPYNQLSLGGESAELLLIDQATWNSWFEQSAEASCLHVGRRPKELSVWYLPDLLVAEYCTDTINGFDHASGTVAATYHGLYAVPQLEAIQLWERLAAKVPTTTAFQCAPLQPGR